MGKHTPTPWVYEYRGGDHPQNSNGGWGAGGLWSQDGVQIFGDDIGWDGGFIAPNEEDAAFIVRACNAHQALLQFAYEYRNLLEANSDKDEMEAVDAVLDQLEGR